MPPKKKKRVHSGREIFTEEQDTPTSSITISLDEDSDVAPTNHKLLALDAVSLSMTSKDSRSMLSDEAHPKAQKVIDTLLSSRLQGSSQLQSLSFHPRPCKIGSN
ncbi:hypothetical protein FRC03_001879 [Tulasnella sp. 419]|nr:hypothetical protein FRC03_001879 [Tulasnella sp. 419]